MTIFTATAALSGSSLLSVMTPPIAQPSEYSAGYSGIVLNQNLATANVALSDDYIVQDFYLPKNYSRGLAETTVGTIPALTGFQVLVNVDEGFEDAASLEWYLSHYEDGTGWIGLAQGTTVGAPASGETWFTVYFDPIDVPSDWLTQRFRFAIKGQTVSGGRHHEVVDYDGTYVYVDNVQIPVIPTLSPVPLEEGHFYPFDFEGVPSVLYVEPGSGAVYYSEQQGISDVYYGSPNPLALQFVKAFGPDGVTPLVPVSDEVSLAFRILAATADEGTDFLGNQYRAVVRREDGSNVSTTSEADLTAFWLSKPNPSRFAVESLYFDVRDGDDAVTLDNVLIDPLTPGVFFSVYYSSDISPGVDNSSWEQLLWTPVPKLFRMNQREHHALPEPITAKYIKIEFSHLQARYYAPGDFQKPLVYKKHPKWVSDYYLSNYIAQSYVANQVQVVYDAINFAYSYYTDDINPGPNPPVNVIDPNKFALTPEDATEQIDPHTLFDINLSVEPYTQHPTASAPFGSLLGVFDPNYSVENIQRAVANVLEVSTLDRDSLIVEKNYPVMQFYVPCRHGYREALASFEKDNAYFVGVKEISFTRNHYYALSDEALYIESTGDNVNIAINDFERLEDNWTTGPPSRDITIDANVDPPTPPGPPALEQSWLPLTTFGPPSFAVDEDGVAFIDLPSYNPTPPDQATWEADRWPVDYYDQIVDGHAKLVGRWRLNDTGTTILDEKGNHGTLSGAHHSSLSTLDHRHWLPLNSLNLFSASTFLLTVTEVNVGTGTWPLNWSTNVVVNAFDVSGNFLQSSAVTAAAATHANVDFQISWSAVPSATTYKVYRGGASTVPTPGSDPGFLHATLTAPTAVTTITQLGGFPWFDYGVSEKPYSLGPNSFGTIDVGSHHAMTANTTFTVGFLYGGAAREYTSINGPSVSDSDPYDNELFRFPSAENNSSWIIKKLDPVAYTESTTTPTVAASTSAATTTNTTSLAVTIPASTAVGDLLVLGTDWAGTTQDSGFNTPTGWKFLNSESYAFGGRETVQCWWRIAQIGDAGSTVTLTSPVSGTGAAGILRIINHDPHNPLEFNDSSSGSGTGTSIHDWKMQGPHRLALVFHGQAGNFASDISTSVTNYTEIFDTQATSDGTLNARSGLAAYRQDTTTSNQLAAGTVSYGAGSFGEHVFVQLIIRPRRTTTTAVNGWGVKLDVGGTPWIERWSAGDYDAKSGIGLANENFYNYMTYDGTNLTRGDSDPDPVPSSRSVGATASNLVIGEKLSASIQDIQLYSPALTEAEQSAIEQAHSNPYTTPSGGFYNVNSLNQFDNFEITMKYNIGRSDDPNNFIGTQTDPDSESGLQYDVNLGIAFKVSSDHQKYLNFTLSPTTTNISSSAPFTFAADGGAYTEGIFAENTNYVLPAPLWEDDGIYWMRVRMQGEKVTLSHWSTDPTLGGIPDYEGSVTFVANDLIDLWGRTVKGGYAIAPWTGTPTTQILSYEIEVLDPPDPPVVPALSGPAFLGRVDYPGAATIETPIASYHETWSPDDFSSAWTRYTAPGFYPDGASAGTVTSGVLGANANAGNYTFGVWANESQHLTEGNCIIYKVKVPSVAALTGGLYFGFGDNLSSYMVYWDGATGNAQLQHVTNLTRTTTLLESFTNVSGSGTFAIPDNQWFWAVVRWGFQTSFNTNNFSFEVYSTDPFGGSGTLVGSTSIYHPSTDTLATQINAHLRSPIFGWEGDQASANWVQVDDVWLGDIGVLAPNDGTIPTNDPRGVTLDFPVVGSGVVDKIDVSFYVTEPFAYDSLITLTAPDGTTHPIVNWLWDGGPDLGTGSADNQRTVITDNALDNITDSDLLAPYVGQFTPSGWPMSVFRNHTAAGTWKVNIQTFEDGGTINDVSLIFHS
jgi:hypothetical protein